MALTSQPTPWYIKYLPGMNNKAEPQELQDKYVEVAQNCRFETQPGTVIKREPTTYFNDTTIDASNPIMGLYRFYRSDGTAKFITVCNDEVLVGDDATGVFTAIRTLTTTGKRMCFVTYKDLCIGGNGFDALFCYDGSADNVTWELGSCKAKIGVGTGITRTAITYRVTMDDDFFVCGATSNTIASVTNQNILLSNIPLGPVGTVNRKIYRKSSETGGQYRLIATISDNITTTYTDNTSDASLGAAYPAVTDSIPKGALLSVNRERLFVTRDPTAPNKIYYSDPYVPHYIQKDTQLTYLEISPEDNDEIMGIPVVLGTMLCIKKNTIRKIFINGPTLNWYAEDPFSFSGSPAAWSICQTPYGIIYLGWDHWYIYDGSNAQPIIDEFDTYEILPANYYDVVSWWDETEFLAAYTNSESGSSVHDRVMRYNFKRQSLSYDTLNVNCFASKRGDQETGELYYGSSVQGFVYKSVTEDLQYRLFNKTQADAGTKTNVFVGGIEAAPYIEIGTPVSADPIPDNICILWDNADIDPGSGWTEITDKNARFIFIDNVNAPGTTANNVGVSGSTNYSTFVSRDFRIFRKNASTTEYEFPFGAIIFWDQTTAPTGFVPFDIDGAYVTINSVISETITDEDNLTTTNTGTGTANNIENTLSMFLIKKVGESGSWDGFAYYCYALYYAVAAPGNGWTDVTSTYTGHYLRGKASGSPETAEGTDTASGVDFVQLPTTFHYETGDAQGATDSKFNFTKEEGYDRNDSTYREYYAKHSGDGSVTATMTHEHTWVYPKSIADIYVKMQQATFGGNYKDSKRRYIVSLCIDGEWTEVYNQFYDDAAGSNSIYTETKTVTSATGWDNVTGIRVYLNGYAYSYEGTRRQEVWLRVFEAQCNTNYKRVSFHLARKVLGKMREYNAAVETPAFPTTGTWTSPSVQLNPLLLKNLWWNETLVGTDNITVSMRTGDTQALCEAAAWVGPFGNPNAQPIDTVAAAAWIQYKIDFSCTDSTVSNPRVYSANGYLLKFSYSKGYLNAENSVEFKYDMGFRHFDAPMIDKIFQKIMIYHEGDTGSFDVYWETENDNGTFTVDLGTNPQRWASFFPSNAFGKQIKIRIYKNDLYSFKVKEIQGFYSPQPLII
jgi:hypothetical protein